MHPRRVQDGMLIDCDSADSVVALSWQLKAAAGQQRALASVSCNARSYKDDGSDRKQIVHQFRTGKRFLAMHMNDSVLLFTSHDSVKS